MCCATTVGTIEYTEQLTYLLFLKMAHERETRALNPERIVPENCSWQRLLDADGDYLEVTYRHILGPWQAAGHAGVIFRKAQNRIQDPAKLKRLIVDPIDKENWSATGTDIKGDAYEELLSKGAEDVKSGAGQYFTPRPLIQAMVDCVRPTIRDTVVDPAYRRALEPAFRAEVLADHGRRGRARGPRGPRDRAAGLRGHHLEQAAQIRPAHRHDPGHQRPAAVVLPDNVLFEGGAGETLRRRLLRDFDLHTMLRLPTGIFYAQGVKANVLFFDKKPAGERPWTERLWVYDLRTNQHFTLKQNPLRRMHLDEFVDCYAPGKARSERVESERFKSFPYDELMARDKANLDITWLRDDSLEDLDSLPAPEVIAREIVEDLTAALAEFEAVAAALELGAIAE
jgi:type I restriction-modification system DNA methylase subunit